MLTIQSKNNISVFQIRIKLYIYANANSCFKQISYIQGDHRNALLREKWSKNPELPPEFEHEKPLYFWPVTLASMHGEAQMYSNK